MKINISVAIATHNEENTIENCINSVKDWVREIVVADGESTDKTVQILSKYGVKVIKRKNEKMFHINKQHAIDTCTSEWILQLDADEVVPHDLKTEISTLLQKSSTGSVDSFNGYWIPRSNFFLGSFLKKGGQYPDYTLRLYKKGKGYLPCKNVHEQAKVEGKVSYLQNSLLHYPYPNFSHYLEHFNRYTDLFAQELNDDKLRINLFSHINFIFLKPFIWFCMTYVRHKGVLDGFPGFVFSFFSSLRFPVSYIKYWERVKNTHRKSEKL